MLTRLALPDPGVQSDTIGLSPGAALSPWLSLLERRHPRPVDLGLERVASVWRRLGAPRPARWVVTVGGTNGKGSVAAFLSAAAASSGWRTGTYTSPHISRYNERIRIGATAASDDEIVACFERIEAARGDVSLTYFEFGTLAALLLMAADGALDLAILEVGLGGRLDAVNIIDADVAVITTIAMDHQDWLGNTRAAIAREKAGIARRGHALIIGERDVEPALLVEADRIGAVVQRLGDEFDCTSYSGGRCYFQTGYTPVALPSTLPLAAPCQWDNAVTALAALNAVARLDARGASGLARSPLVDRAAAAVGLAQARLPGRLEQLAQAPDVIVDVGHNPQAAAMLARWLAEQGGAKRTVAVFSALADKDIDGIVEPLLPLIDRWYVAGLAHASTRGLEAGALGERVRRRMREMSPPDPADGDAVRDPGHVQEERTVTEGLSAAMQDVGPDGRILVFGSFLVVAEAGNALRRGL